MQNSIWEKKQSKGGFNRGSGDGLKTLITLSFIILSGFGGGITHANDGAINEPGRSISDGINGDHTQPSYGNQPQPSQPMDGHKPIPSQPMEVKLFQRLEPKGKQVCVNAIRSLSKKNKNIRKEDQYVALKMPKGPNYEVITFNAYYPYFNGSISKINQGSKYNAIKLGRDVVKVNDSGLDLLIGKKAKKALKYNYKASKHKDLTQSEVSQKIEEFLFNFGEFYQVELTARQYDMFGKCHYEMSKVAETDLDHSNLEKFSASFHTNEVEKQYYSENQEKTGSASQL